MRQRIVSQRDITFNLRSKLLAKSSCTSPFPSHLGQIIKLGFFGKPAQFGKMCDGHGSKSRYIKGDLKARALSENPPVNKPKYTVEKLIASGPVCQLRHDFKVSSRLHSGTTKLNEKFRLDRLLLLLDTGSSPSVRNTAAKQLAQLAVKSVISDVTIVEDDIKTGTSRQHIPRNDSTAWAELLSVVARVCTKNIYYAFSY